MNVECLTGDSLTDKPVIWDHFGQLINQIDIETEELIMRIESRDDNVTFQMLNFIRDLFLREIEAIKKLNIDVYDRARTRNNLKPLIYDCLDNKPYGNELRDMTFYDCVYIKRDDLQNYPFGSLFKLGILVITDWFLTNQQLNNLKYEKLVILKIYRDL